MSDLTKDWNLYYMARLDSTTLDIAKRLAKHYDSVPYNSLHLPCDIFCIMSMHKSVTLDTVKENPDISWDFEMLSANPNITFEMITTINPSDLGYPEQTWSIFTFVNSNPNATIENLRKLHKLGLIDLANECICATSFSFEDIKNNLDIHWNKESLSTHKEVTIDIIKNYPQIQFDRRMLSANPNVTMDIVKANPEIFVHTELLSANPGITMQDIINNPQYRWWTGQILKNNNITIEYIEKYMLAAGDSYKYVDSIWKARCLFPWNQERIIAKRLYMRRFLTCMRILSDIGEIIHAYL